jgi:predicted metal-dependent hydrolase
MAVRQATFAVFSEYEMADILDSLIGLIQADRNLYPANGTPHDKLYEAVELLHKAIEALEQVPDSAPGEGIKLR